MRKRALLLLLGLGLIVIEAGSSGTPPASNGSKPNRPAGNAATEMRAAPEPAGGDQPVASGHVRHAGMAAKVSVSSTSRAAEGEGPPEALIDGDLATRWSSEYAQPQHVELHFGKALKIERIRLHWEQACATRYALSLSADGEIWKPVHLHFSPNAEPVDRVDDIAVNELLAKAIRLEMLARVNTNWGFSLYEIEVVAAD